MERQITTFSPKEHLHSETFLVLFLLIAAASCYAAKRRYFADCHGDPAAPLESLRCRVTDAQSIGFWFGRFLTCIQSRMTQYRLSL